MKMMMTVIVMTMMVMTRDGGETRTRPAHIVQSVMIRSSDSLGWLEDWRREKSKEDMIDVMESIVVNQRLANGRLRMSM